MSIIQIISCSAPDDPLMQVLSPLDKGLGKPKLGRGQGTLSRPPIQLVAELVLGSWESDFKACDCNHRSSFNNGNTSRKYPEQT
jgi:hypothetical protein